MELKDGDLKALERPWAIAVRRNGDLLDQIYQAVNGPFHVIHPSTFSENLQSFNLAFEENGVDGKIFFGKKANKSGAWLREVAANEGSVDVASVQELSHSLANGVRGEDIGVTGAAKSNDLLWLASRHNCVVAIDSIDELSRALKVIDRKRPLKILLRVLPPNSPNSRFGFNPNDLNSALECCERHTDALSMIGFSFHLDGYAVAPRVELASYLIALCIATRRSGLNPSVISIGGGFACRFVDEVDWNVFKSEIGPTNFHAGKEFQNFYPYYQTPTGADMLRAILRSPSGDFLLADKLREHGITIYAEPGRALLDGAGFSVFPVQGFKRNAAHGIVTVSGLSMSISEQWKNSEFLVHPHLVQRGNDRAQESVRAAIGGSSCMEYDMLTWRKVKFPAEPRFGDFIVYPNTAGYQMDKNESEFHQLPLPPKITIRNKSQGLIWSIEHA